MKWFSSAMLGVLAANNLGFAWLWLESAKLFGQRQCQGDMACPKSATQSLLNIVTSLIGPIWSKWNGSAVPCLVCWLQTTLVLARLWLESAKLFCHRQCQGDMACQKSVMQSLLNIVTSLISLIWGIWNGSAVPCLVCWEMKWSSSSFLEVLVT